MRRDWHKALTRCPTLDRTMGAHYLLAVWVATEPSTAARVCISTSDTCRGLAAGHQDQARGHATYAYIRLHSQLIVMRHRRDRRDTFSAIGMPLVDVKLGIVQQLVLRVVEAGGGLAPPPPGARGQAARGPQALAAEPPLRGRMREAFARGAEHSICRRMRPVIVRVWLRCAPALRWQPALVPAL